MIKEILNNALRLGACELAKKPTDWHEIVDLLFSPQGVEFCMEHNFPTLEMWRDMPIDTLAELGVFVDAGNVTINNMQNVAIIGNTNAHIICDTCKEVYKIIAMHGAVANVVSLDYSVTRIYKDADSNIDTRKDETAKILM